MRYLASLEEIPLFAKVAGIFSWKQNHSQATVILYVFNQQEPALKTLCLKLEGNGKLCLINKLRAVGGGWMLAMSLEGNVVKETGFHEPQGRQRI